MTSTAEAQSKIRLLAAAAVLAVALPLSGCLLPPPAADPTPTEEPADSPEPSDEPAEAGGDLPAELSFEAGQELTATTHIEWADGLLMDDAWEIAAPDDGNGNWSYRTIDGTCTASFWQGLLEGLAATSDDQLASDELLALVLKAEVAEVSPHAVDGAFAYQVGDDLSVANRVITGQQDARTWILAARAFTQPAVGMYLIVDCTGGDVMAVMDEVVSKSQLVAVP